MLPEGKLYYTQIVRAKASICAERFTKSEKSLNLTNVRILPLT